MSSPENFTIFMLEGTVASLTCKCSTYNYRCVCVGVGGGAHEVIVTKKQIFNFMVEFGSKFYCEEVMLKQGCFAGCFATEWSGFMFE